MTGTHDRRGWRRGVLNGIAGAAVAIGMVFGSTAVAQADVLDDLAEDYAVGTGGGQLSNLLRISLKLRAMGYKPSKVYLDELTAAMEYRPNQNPLINALKDTIAYQAKIKAQTELLQTAQSQQNANSAVMGAGQMPAASNPGTGGTSAGGTSTGGASTGGASTGGTQAGVVAPVVPAQ
jgi:hypothetical protein